jgi:hypothetical protein
MSAVSIDAPHLTVGDLCNLAGVPNEAYKTASLDALREIASDLFTHDEQGDIPKTKSAIMKYIAAQVRLREELDSPMSRLDSEASSRDSREYLRHLSTKMITTIKTSRCMISLMTVTTQTWTGGSKVVSRQPPRSSPSPTTS